MAQCGLVPCQLLPEGPGPPPDRFADGVAAYSLPRSHGWHLRSAVALLFGGDGLLGFELSDHPEGDGAGDEDAHSSIAHVLSGSPHELPAVASGLQRFDGLTVDEHDLVLLLLEFVVK